MHRYMKNELKKMVTVSGKTPRVILKISNQSFVICDQELSRDEAMWMRRQLLVALETLIDENIDFHRP